MALIECPGCGHKISSLAKQCPKCGFTSQSGATVSPDRKPPPPPSPPTDAATLPKDMPGETGRPSSPSVWYFVTATGRNGPVTREFLLKLASDRQIGDDTKIWKSGMADWTRFSEMASIPEETVHEESAPTMTLTFDKFMGWMLAFAPISGTIVQLAVTEALITKANASPAYYAEMWWLFVVTNILTACTDFSHLRKSGRNGNRLKFWHCLLPPLYIFHRGKLKGVSMLILWIWTGTFVLSLATLFWLNSIYSQIAPG